MSSKIKKAKEYCKSNGLSKTMKKIYRHISFRMKIKKPRKSNSIYKLSRKEREKISLKTKNKIFIFTDMPYFDKSKENGIAKIAKTFNDMGYIVKYFYAFNANQIVKYNTFLPIVEHKKINKINIEEFKKNINKEDIFIFDGKQEMFLPFLELAKNKQCKIICEKINTEEDCYLECSKIIDNFNQNNKCSEDFYNNISVIILNYNNKNVIENCINSILKFNERYQIEIIVVDNKSTDGSYEILQEKYKDKIKLYQNSKNGCSSGRNLGVKNSTKDYIMFLDSDQWVLHKYWIEPYIEILSRDKTIGAIGWAAGWFNKEGYSYNVVDSFPYKYMPPIGLYRSDIGYLGTGGLIIKKELFNKVEGFDLYYDPTCYEDTDLSLKIRNAGFELAYTTYLGIGHLPHQTTKTGTKQHDDLIKNKGDYFVQKWKKINPKLLKYIK